MSRLDGLNERYLYDRLRRLEIDLNELKTRQPTSGRSGVLSYLTQSGGDWDFTKDLASPSIYYGNTINIIVTFTSDESQKHPIINPFIVMEFAPKGSNNFSEAEFNGEKNGYFWSSGSNQIVAYDTLSETDDYIESDYKIKWLMSISFFGEMRMRAKVIAKGTSSGSLNVETEIYG